MFCADYENGTARNPVLDSSLKCLVRSGLVSMSRGRPYLHVFLLCSKLWLEVSDKAVSKSHVRALVEMTMTGSKKEKGNV
jgi:hypothetical protein